MKQSLQKIGALIGNAAYDVWYGMTQSKGARRGAQEGEMNPLVPQRMVA